MRKMLMLKDFELFENLFGLISKNAKILMLYMFKKKTTYL